MQTGGYCAGGLKRLLIEAGFFTTLTIKALRADRHKVAVGCAALRFREPIQRFETGRDHAIIWAG